MARAGYLGAMSDERPLDPPEPAAAPSDDTPAALRRARGLAWLLDDLLPIPGTSWRVGLDPLLGLLPGLGDWISWGMGLHLIWSAGRLGARAGLLLRMAGNLVVDAVVGAVPLLGDVFDMAWKANDRNLALLEDHVRDAARTERTSRWIVGTILGGSGALLGGAVWLTVSILRMLLEALF